MKKKNVDMVESVKNEEKEITIKESNKKGLIITICMAVVLILGLVFTYTKLLNPKSIFVKSVNKGYEKLENLIVDNKTNTTKLNKPIMITSDVKFNMSMDEALADESSKKMMEEFNKLSISEKFGFDQKNKKMLATIKYLYGEDSLMDIGAYLKDEKMFLELKNIYDKYIELPMSISNSNNGKLNLDNDELKYFLSKTKDAVVNNMKSKDFKQSSEKINGDKTIKVTKITYGLSEKSATELSLNFYKSIYKDSKYIKILAKLSNQKESDIKKNIKESIDSIEEVVKEGKLDKEVKVRFGVLVKGLTKKHVGYIFETIDKAKLVYYKNGDNKEFRLSKDNKDLLKSSTKDDKTVITLISQGQEFEITVKKSIKGNKTMYEYELGNQGAKLNGEIVIEKVKENKDGTGERKISADISMMGLVTFKVTADIKIEYTDKIELPDTSNSIKAADLTEEDLANISEKLKNNEGLKSFINMFGSGEQEVVY